MEAREEVMDCMDLLYKMEGKDMKMFRWMFRAFPSQAIVCCLFGVEDRVDMAWQHVWGVCCHREDDRDC